MAVTMVEFALPAEQGGDTVALVANQVERIRATETTQTEIVIGGMTFTVQGAYATVKAAIEAQLT